MANSRQGDLTGKKIMANLKQISGHDDINFFGYGGDNMKSEGLIQTLDCDIGNFPDKEFYTFRKSKNY